MTIIFSETSHLCCPREGTFEVKFEDVVLFSRLKVTLFSSSDYLCYLLNRGAARDNVKLGVLQLQTFTLSLLSIFHISCLDHVREAMPLDCSCSRV